MNHATMWWSAESFTKQCWERALALSSSSTKEAVQSTKSILVFSCAYAFSFSLIASIAGVYLQNQAFVEPHALGCLSGSTYRPVNRFCDDADLHIVSVI